MTQPLETRALQRELSPRSGTSETSFNERFPSFDDTSPYVGRPLVTESPIETHSVVPEYKWPSRRGSQKLRDGRNHGHQSRRSVSEALNKFRTRQGSVSENAQELAEALKAPISYPLIVRTEFR